VPKKIYLIGSLRNPAVPRYANDLRECGFEVFDDWYGAGNEADDKWQDYENGRGRSYREALAGHAAQHIFNFDLKHITAADVVVLVLPAGKSGHLEFGYARGIGKGAVILLDGEPERFDVMYNFAHLVTSEMIEVAQFIDDWKTPKFGPARVIDELQADLNAHKLANGVYLERLARIAYHDAQSGQDAMHMRVIAQETIKPKESL
jgi:nucleoside 2-deoxyribosyltransferase